MTIRQTKLALAPTQLNKNGTGDLSENKKREEEKETFNSGKFQRKKTTKTH